jgi:glycosyltransferase involved in cell wall biosynthesis
MRNPRILFFGLHPPVPTFIKRRINALHKAGVNLVVASYDSNSFSHLPKTESIAAVSLRNPFRLTMLLLRFILWMPGNFQLWRMGRGKRFSARWKWCLEIFQWVHVIGAPDLIHLQWLSPADGFQWLKHFYPGVPIIVSARGSQVTVYPHTDKRAEQTLKINFEQASYIHCVSKDIATHCKQLGCEQSKLLVNYNGIDLSRFVPAKKRVHDSSSISLMSVGLLIWRKGFLFQLQVLKTLIDRGVSVTMHWVGSGPDEMALRYWAHRLNVASHVVFHGHKNEEDVITLLQESDIYISTSAAEGLPNSLVEASACGVPVVTFDCEGVHEIIMHGVSGFIVPFGDVTGMADSIVKLSSQPALLESMGHEARLRMEKSFDERYWLEEIVQFYNQTARSV